MNTTKITTLRTPENPWVRRLDSLNKAWYKYSKNWLSKIGLVMVLTIVFLAIFAPYVTPFPQHAGKFVDFKSAALAPSWTYLMGTI
jgi:peptide/nickel transport system permease protein